MTQNTKRMQFNSTIFIGYMIGMTLIATIFMLEFETFIINAIIILIGIGFVFLISNIE